MRKHKTMANRLRLHVRLWGVDRLVPTWGTVWYNIIQHACAFQAIVRTYVARLRLYRAPAPRACACAARQKMTRHFKYPSADLGCHRFLHRPQGHHRRGCRLGPQTRDLRNDTQKYTYDTQYTHVTQKFIIYAKIIFRFWKCLRKNTVFTQKFSVYAITYQYAVYAIYAKFLFFTQWYANIIAYDSYSGVGGMPPTLR